MSTRSESIPEMNYKLTSRANDLLRSLSEQSVSQDTTSGVGPLQNGFLESIADELLDVTSLSDLQAVLHRKCQLFGIQHSTIHVVAEGSGAFYQPKVLTTYTKKWIDRYFDRGYENIDPIALECLRCSEAFFWNDVISDDTVEASFFEDACSYGVGPSGYTTSIMLENGDRFAVSISSGESHEGFSERIIDLLPGLSVLFGLIVSVFCELATPRQDKVPKFSATQLQILRAFAAAESEEHFRNIPIRFGSLSNVKNEICRKLCVESIDQAVAKAGRLGLLRKVPLYRNNVATIAQYES